ncbi:MAG: glycerophosphodiester phosphodiesterase family protein [Acidobacteriota bacterium]
MSSNPLILGHRGASAVAPENTIAAFSRAMQDGADGIEFDVRLSRDHLPVVIHDSTLKRTGLIDTLVKELTAAELQDVDVGSWLRGKPGLNRSYVGERLPSLSRVLQFFSTNNGLLYIEMKCDADEGPLLAAEVVRLTRKHQMVDRVVVESFDLFAIGEIKRIDACIRTAALFEPKLSRPVSSIRRLKMVDLALQQQADEIALHHTLAGRSVVERARHEGLDVVVWTVDDDKWIARARSMGVKALIANDPGKMVKHRS